MGVSPSDTRMHSDPYWCHNYPQMLVYNDSVEKYSVYQMYKYFNYRFRRTVMNLDIPDDSPIPDIKNFAYDHYNKTYVGIESDTGYIYHLDKYTRDIAYYRHIFDHPLSGIPFDATTIYDGGVGDTPNWLVYYESNRGAYATYLDFEVLPQPLMSIPLEVTFQDHQGSPNYKHAKIVSFIRLPRTGYIGLGITSNDGGSSYKLDIYTVAIDIPVGHSTPISQGSLSFRDRGAIEIPSEVAQHNLHYGGGFVDGDELILFGSGDLNSHLLSYNLNHGYIHVIQTYRPVDILGFVYCRSDLGNSMYGFNHSQL